MLLLICALLLIVVLALSMKLFWSRKALRAITTELQEKLTDDTNTLISVTTNDRAIRELASELNQQLRLLRDLRQRYQSGDHALKEAISNISHDLRTPLTAICGYLDLLAKEEHSADGVRYLHCIENRAQALKQLTEELFRYSVVLADRDDMILEPIAIDQVLEESIAAFYATLTQRGITPVISIPEQKIYRSLNKTALSRIFSNVLHNALKYSDGDLSIVLHDDGEIIFTNTATTLDDVQVGKLFDRFFTVEAARHSTGLGLAIAKELIQKMHGTIMATYHDEQLNIHITFADR